MVSVRLFACLSVCQTFIAQAKFFKRRHVILERNYDNGPSYEHPLLEQSCDYADFRKILSNYEDITSSLYDSNLAVRRPNPIKIGLPHCLKVTIKLTGTNDKRR